LRIAKLGTRPKGGSPQDNCGLGDGEKSEKGKINHRGTESTERIFIARSEDDDRAIETQPSGQFSTIVGARSTVGVAI